MMDGLKALKAFAQGFEDRRECDALHDHYGDGEDGCGSRSCSQCKADFLRCALSDIERRVMPEGMEWPRFEDGDPVRIGGEISWRDDGGAVNSIELQDGGYFILHAADGADDWIHPQYFPGERVERPALKVLDADGVEIKVGDEVWEVGEACQPMEVLEIKPDDDPDEPEHLVWCGDMCWGYREWRIADHLTHERPDSWERLEEDADLTPVHYAKKYANQRHDSNAEFQRKDLVRRAKALAEREAR